MKQKSKFWGIIKLCIFVFAMILVLYYVSKLLSFKYRDGIWGMKKIYELDDNSVDVLVLGSSHAFEDVNTGVLFDSYGIAAYVLAGSVQPYWNTYYYLLEALKTQRPQLIILEAYASTLEYEYGDHSRVIKNNLGIKALGTLYESLRVSVSPEAFDDYWFHYRLWHSRYSELSEADCEAFFEAPYYKYFKGFGINFAVDSFEMPDVGNMEDTIPLTKKTEEYYRKIIELSIEEDIPLLVVVSPYVLSEKEQMKFHESKRIAEEYGIEFINYNSTDYYNSMGLEFDADFADAAHLNCEGNIKYTRLLGDFICTKYDLPDRRMDSAYESWQLHSRDVLGRMRNYYLKKQTDLGTYIKELQNDENDYTVVMMTVSNTSGIKEFLPQLSAYGIDIEQLKDGCLYVIKDNKICYQGTELCWKYNEMINGNELKIEQKMKFANAAEITNSMSWNGTEYMADQKGIIFFVYDNFSKEIVEVSNFYLNSQGAVCKK